MSSRAVLALLALCTLAITGCDENDFSGKQTYYVGPGTQIYDFPNCKASGKLDAGVGWKSFLVEKPAEGIIERRIVCEVDERGVTETRIVVLLRTTDGRMIAVLEEAIQEI